VADLLGIERVIAPACAGVLAAVGTLIAGERRDWVQTVLLPIGDAGGLAAALAPCSSAPGGPFPARASRSPRTAVSSVSRTR